MSDEYQFWTHGVNAIVEDDSNLKITRSANGLILERTGGTPETWVHFPIPSATRLDDDAVSVYHAWLIGWAGDDTMISAVVVKMASRNIGDNLAKMEPKPIFEDRRPVGVVPIVDGRGSAEFGVPFSRDFDIVDVRCTGPIVISAYVKFLQTGKAVHLTGAGARFEEHF